MGIKGLNNLIKQYLPGNKKNIKEYSGFTIAIDAEILMYKFRNASGKQNTYPREEYHKYALLDNILKFLQNGILPVYVFDGKPPSAKEGCLIKRSMNREKNLKELQESSFFDSELCTGRKCH